MGTSIYIVVEVKIDRWDPWMSAGICEPNSDYDIFAKIADPRNEAEEKGIKTLSWRAGLPADLSKVAQAYFTHGTADHTFGWLTGKATRQLAAWMEGSLSERRPGTRLLYLEDWLGMYHFGRGWTEKSGFCRSQRLLFGFNS